MLGERTHILLSGPKNPRVVVVEGLIAADEMVVFFVRTETRYCEETAGAVKEFLVHNCCYSVS